MTFVGKIFVVLQLVLAVCFMGWAAAVYTTHTNWQEEAQNLTEQKEQLQGQLAKAESSLQKLKTTSTSEINELEEKTALLSGQNETLSQQVSRLESELEAALASVDRHTTMADLAQDQAQFRKEEALRQRARSARLQQQITDLQKKLRSLENTLFEKEVAIADMKERHQRVVDKMAMYRKMLLANNAPLDPNDYPELENITEPPPQVVGRVLDTQTSRTTGTQFIAISLGRDDGFRKNDQLMVYRSGDFLGRIRLTSVDTDKAVGQLIPGSAPRDSSIQKGDHVRPQTDNS